MLKTWKDVTLNQYQLINDIKSEGIDYTLDKLSILFNMNKTQLEEMEITKLYEMIDSIKWMDEEFIPCKTTPDKIGKYELVEFDQLSVGQSLGIEEYYKQDLNKNLHFILSYLYLEPGKLYNIDFEERSEYMKTIDCDTLFNITAFFLNIVQIYSKNTQDSINQKTQEMMEKMEKKLEELKDQN